MSTCSLVAQRPQQATVSSSSASNANANVLLTTSSSSNSGQQQAILNNNGNLKNITYQDHNYGVPYKIDSVVMMNGSCGGGVNTATLLSSPSSSSSSSSMSALGNGNCGGGGILSIGNKQKPAKSLSHANIRYRHQSHVQKYDDRHDLYEREIVYDERRLHETNGEYVDDEETLSNVSDVEDEEVDESDEEEEDDDEDDDDDNTDITRCICNLTHDDGFMICCDRCQVWQHIICMEISKNKIPDKYYCELCVPRSQQQQQQQHMKQQRKTVASTSSSITRSNENDSAVCRPMTINGIVQQQQQQQQQQQHHLMLNDDVNTTTDDNDDTMHSDPHNHNGNDTQRKEKKQKNKKLPANYFEYYNTSYTEVTANVYTQSVVKLLNEYKQAQKQVLGQNTMILNHNSINNTNVNVNVNNSGLNSNNYNLKNQININCLSLIKTRQPWRLKINSPIKQNQIIIEYFGRILHANELSQETATVAAAAAVTMRGASCLSPLASSSSTSTSISTSTLPSSTTTATNPFLIYYNNLENFNLCIDSSTCGNIARFIRKSCTPNCNLKHLIDVNGQLHFVIVSISNIPKNVELTLPYETIYDSRYAVCNCTKPNCILKSQIKVEDKKKPNRKSISESVTVTPNGHPNGKRKTDSDVNGSTTPNLNSKKSEETKSQLTREDRKLISYVKVIEKLEKQTKRKRDKLNTSNGEHEGVSMSSSCPHECGGSERRKSIDEPVQHHVQREIIWQAKVNKEPKASSNGNNNSKENRKSILNNNKTATTTTTTAAIDSATVQGATVTSSTQESPQLDGKSTVGKVEANYEVVLSSQRDTDTNNVLQLNTNLLNSENNGQSKQSDVNNVVNYDFKSKKQMASTYCQVKPGDDNNSFIHLTIEPRQQQQTLDLLKRDLVINTASPSTGSDTTAALHAPLTPTTLTTTTPTPTPPTPNNDELTGMQQQLQQQIGTSMPKKRWLKCFSMEQPSVQYEAHLKSTNEFNFQHQSISLDPSMMHNSILSSPLSDFSDSNQMTNAPLKKRRYLYKDPTDQTSFTDQQMHQYMYTQQVTEYEQHIQHQLQLQFLYAHHPYLFNFDVNNPAFSPIIAAAAAASMASPLICDPMAIGGYCDVANMMDVSQCVQFESVSSADNTMTTNGNTTVPPSMDTCNHQAQDSTEPLKRKKVSLAEYRQRKERPSLPGTIQKSESVDNQSALNCSFDDSTTTVTTQPNDNSLNTTIDENDPEQHESGECSRIIKMEKIEEEERDVTMAIAEAVHVEPKNELKTAIVADKEVELEGVNEIVNVQNDEIKKEEEEEVTEEPLKTATNSKEEISVDWNQYESISIENEYDITDGEMSSEDEEGQIKECDDGVGIEVKKTEQLEKTTSTCNVLLTTSSSSSSSSSTSSSSDSDSEPTSSSPSSSSSSSSELDVPEPDNKKQKLNELPNIRSIKLKRRKKNKQRSSMYSSVSSSSLSEDGADHNNETASSDTSSSSSSSSSGSSSGSSDSDDDDDDDTSTSTSTSTSTIISSKAKCKYNKISDDDNDLNELMKSPLNETAHAEQDDAKKRHHKPEQQQQQQHKSRRHSYIRISHSKTTSSRGHKKSNSNASSGGSRHSSGSTNRSVNRYHYSNSNSNNSSHHYQQQTQQQPSSSSSSHYHNTNQHYYNQNYVNPKYAASAANYDSQTGSSSYNKHYRVKYYNYRQPSSDVLYGSHNDRSYFDVNHHKAYYNRSSSYSSRYYIQNNDNEQSTYSSSPSSSTSPPPPPPANTQQQQQQTTTSSTSSSSTSSTSYNYYNNNHRSSSNRNYYNYDRGGGGGGGGGGDEQSSSSKSKKRRHTSTSPMPK